MPGESELNETLLDDRLGALEGARSWSPRVVSKLETLIRSGSDDDLFRINPIRYAADRDVDESEAVDLFLHATKDGLFDMDWLIVCGACANVASSFRSLGKVEPQFTCDLCSYDSTAHLDNYIHVTFTVTPQVRPIRFHDQRDLTVEELYFRQHRSTDVKPLASGSTVPEILQRWTKLLTYLEPGETAEVEVTPRGVVAVMDVLGSASVHYVADPSTGSGPTGLSLERSDHGLRDTSGTPVGPFEMAIPEGRSFYADDDEPLRPVDADTPLMAYRLPAVGQIPAGPVAVRIHNISDERASAWVVDYPPVPQQASSVEFWPVLTGKQLLSNQTFRDLFRSESIPESESFVVEDLTYLFTDLKDSTLMYDTVGDVTAYNLVRRHFDAIMQAVADNRGAVTKTIGDAIMATFPAPADAVRAAFAMLERLDDFNRLGSTHLVLKIGMHRGRSLAVTLNERVDYFGQEVNIAARVQQLAGAGEVVLSEDVFQASGVAELIDSFNVVPDSGIMKGVAETIPVYRVTPKRRSSD